jgi:hypothetical protein
VDIHDALLDDTLTTRILRELVADCRSDSELISVALGAREHSMHRLTNIVREGMASQKESDRARARFVAGWMPDGTDLRQSLAAPDRSKWVEDVGRNALWRLDRERWARHWFARFLAEPNRIRRWAAGRLFLECADVATPLWAPRMIYENANIPAVRRAQAQLLVWKVRQKPDDSRFRDNFLGYSVRDVTAVAPPWRQAKQWDNVEHDWMSDD